jgi:TetR/AcrR family transcriptional regulator, mexJK operon transcriptional repressor
MSSDASRRSGGRPTARAAALLETAILDQATAAFLADGYAATTIEAIARSCGVAKRTIYARWSGKAALFRAVLERLMAGWMSTTGDWSDNEGLEATLKAAADDILSVALTPEAIALHRLLIAESGRFPELPAMLHQAGAGAGTARIAALLDRAMARGAVPQTDTVIAAEQFLHLLLVGPQRRAMGLGHPFDDHQIKQWRDSAVALFLTGIHSLRLPHGRE